MIPKSTLSVKIQTNGDEITINVPGSVQTSISKSDHRYVETNYQNHLLSEIVQSFAVGDVCLIGAKGSGKSILISQIAHLLNQNIEPMVLYQDMTARDFVQQRTTTPTGDTVWRDSPLIRAAKTGSIAVLDGIHRIHSSVISILHRFEISFHSRTLSVFGLFFLIHFSDSFTIGKFNFMTAHA